MRRVVVLVLCLAGLTASATAYRYKYETQPCTAGSCSRSSNPSASTDGMALGSARGWRVTVCAASGQTLSGGGTVQIWAMDPDIDGNGTALWGRNTALDFTPDSGVRCTFRDFKADVRLNGWRVQPVASSVTVSGGASIQVNVNACLQDGC